MVVFAPLVLCTGSGVILLIVPPIPRASDPTACAHSTRARPSSARAGTSPLGLGQRLTFRGQKVFLIWRLTSLYIFQISTLGWSGRAFRAALG
jgi:hypothetical protein